MIIKIGLADSSYDPLTLSHPNATSDADCCSLLLSGHLLLLGDHSGVRLLLEEGPSLVGLGLQVLEVADETDRIDDALVVEQHARDLTSSLAVLLLDNLINIVTDLLTTLTGLKALDALKILLAYKHLLLLLLLLSSHHLLLLKHLSLLR